MTTTFRVHDDATADVLHILSVDRVAGARIAALIQEWRTDPKLAEKFLDHGFGSDHDEPISVSMWHSVKRVERLPIWRVKSWELEDGGMKYRFFYCYDFSDYSFNLLAVVRRSDVDYDDPSWPRRKRMIDIINEEFPNA